MKTKCLFIIISIYINLQLFSQEILLKNFNFTKNDKNEWGDININKSLIKIDSNNNISRIFEIDVPEEGEYYLSAWLMAAEINNEYKQYEIQINNKPIKNKIKPQKNNWQKVELIDTELKPMTIFLNKGHNRIAFISSAPEVPQVEFICLSKNRKKIKFTDQAYNDYITSIKTEIKERQKNPIVYKDSLFLKAMLPNPEGNYYHQIKIPFSYTFYTNYVPSGYIFPQQVIFTTNAADGYEHVLEVFSYSNPENYSWAALSNSNGVAYLRINITRPDLYFIRIRAYRQNTHGLVDLMISPGAITYRNCPVSGNGFRYVHETPTTYNYFTCKLSGDSYLWIEDDSGMPGKIRAYNDDYSGSGDFKWGVASRVKRDFSVNIGAALISSYSSYNPNGICDLYMMCQNSTIGPSSSFPNLKADDAIQSASSTNVYNCASWAGGITNGWFWGCKYPNQNGGSCLSYFYGSPYSWDIWKNYFGNYPVQRYEVATTYTDEGANSSNGSIAVWSTNGDETGITHFSVRNYANNLPHGYDWESKPGSDMRTFHPRDALNGPLYGSIFAYFKESTALKSFQTIEIMTFDESVALGLTVVESIKLTDAEKNILKSANESNNNSELDILFDAWLQTLYKPELAANSNPYLFFENDEFKHLYDYCMNHEKASIAYVADKLYGNDLTSFESEITSIFFCGFAAKNYKNLLDEVKIGHKLKSYTDEGAYIAPTAVNTTKKFIKKILMANENGIIPSDNELGENKYNGYEYLNIYPNPVPDNSYIHLKLDEARIISVNIYDETGKLVKILVNNQLYNNGQHSVEFSSSGLKPGIYVCKLQTGNETASRKILVK